MISLKGFTVTLLKEECYDLSSMSLGNEPSWGSNLEPFVQLTGSTNCATGAAVSKCWTYMFTRISSHFF